MILSDSAADRLSFVTKPKLRQYNVSIYAAGPAGLSAAVYAASEGPGRPLLIPVTISRSQRTSGGWLSLVRSELRLAPRGASRS